MEEALSETEFLVLFMNWWIYELPTEEHNKLGMHQQAEKFLKEFHKKYCEVEFIEKEED